MRDFDHSTNKPKVIEKNQKKHTCYNNSNEKNQQTDLIKRMNLSIKLIQSNRKKNFNRKKGINICKQGKNIRAIISEMKRNKCSFQLEKYQPGFGAAIFQALVMKYFFIDNVIIYNLFVETHTSVSACSKLPLVASKIPCESAPVLSYISFTDDSKY